MINAAIKAKLNNGTHFGHSILYITKLSLIINYNTSNYKLNHAKKRDLQVYSYFVSSVYDFVQKMISPEKRGIFIL